MPRRYFVLLAAAVLAGAFLRLWRINEVPPGLHYDLAATALLGEAVAFGGFRPIFITAYTGHEPLFYYWLAGWFRLIGSSVFSLRLAAALLGVLAVPAAFFAVRHLGSLLFAAAGPRAARSQALVVAGLSAALLATAFFHIVFSRFGFRVIIEPVVQALALGFLFWGLAGPPLAGAAGRRAYARLALAGAFTGLAAYTYLAARLLPVPLAVFWLALLAAGAGRGLFWPYAKRFAVFAAAALAVFAPLGIYFLRHPDDFLNRAAQVAPRAGEANLFLLGLRRAAEMLFISGDPYDRFNIPFLPLLGPVAGVLFCVGVAVGVKAVISNWRLVIVRKGRLAPTQQLQITNIQLPITNNQLLLLLASELLLLAWLPAMLLPTALAVHDVFPSNVRAFGLLPLLFVYPARGLVALYGAAQRLWPGPLIPYAYPLTVLTLIVLGMTGMSSYRNYFDTWAGISTQRLNNDADLTDIAAYLNAQDLGGTSVYVSAIHYRHPTLAYLARDFDQVLWLTGGSALAVPADGPALVVLARSAPLPAEWTEGWAPFLVAAPLERDNRPAFSAYRFEAGQLPPLPAFDALEENFGNVARLEGYRVEEYDKSLLVDLRWRIDNLPEAGDFLPYARLTDAWGHAWSQSGGFSYPSEQWRPGDLLLTRLSVPLPAGLPPGEYVLRVGLHAAGAQADLPRLAPAGEPGPVADGAYAGVRAPLPPLTLAPAGEPGLGGAPWASAEDMRAEHAPAAPLEQRGMDEAGGPLKLLGYHAATLSPRQGERLSLTLFWQALAQLQPTRLTITLGNRTLYSGQPVRGALPFEQWLGGQSLADRYRLVVPADMPPGPAELVVEVPGHGRALLARLDVQAVARAYDPPPAVVTLGAPAPGSTAGAGALGLARAEPLAALHGYTLAADDAGLSVSLAWQALAAMDEDYTVFVHLLDASGAIIAQADSQPRGGAYPTSLWQPGEFVLDDYRFDVAGLAPGGYSLAVGLYLPETGQRLLPAEGGAALSLPGE